MPTYTAAVVQAAPVAFDRRRTLIKLHDLASDAAHAGAKLAVFPEAFVSGYPRGLDFGARVGMRTPEGREQFRRYYDSAIDVPGSDVDALAELAGDSKLHLVIGAIERAGGTLYCTALFFGSSGHYLGKHRKLMPTGMERLIWGFGDGSTLPVFDTEVGRLGAVICWENYMPLLRMAMYAKGISAVLRANRRRSADVDSDHAARGARRALLRAVVQPVRASVELPGGLRDAVRRGSGRGHLSGRQLHRQSAR